MESIFISNIQLLAFRCSFILFVGIASGGPRDRAAGKRELGTYLGMIFVFQLLGAREGLDRVKVRKISAL